MGFGASKEQEKQLSPLSDTWLNARPPLPGPVRRRTWWRKVREWFRARVFGWHLIVEFYCAECGRTVQAWIKGGKDSHMFPPVFLCRCGRAKYAGDVPVMARYLKLESF